MGSYLPADRVAELRVYQYQRVARVVLQQQQLHQRAESPPANHNGNIENSEGLGKASPDVLRLFSETQRNLLELNRSRLSALDELRVAKNKIADLGMSTLMHSTKCCMPNVSL